MVAVDRGGNYMERQKCFSGEVDDVTMKIKGGERRDEKGFCRDDLLYLYVGLMPYSLSLGPNRSTLVDHFLVIFCYGRSTTVPVPPNR